MTPESRIALIVVGTVSLVALTLYGLQTAQRGGDSPSARVPRPVVEVRAPAPPQVAAAAAATAGVAPVSPPAAAGAERITSARIAPVLSSASPPAWSAIGATLTLQQFYDASLASANAEVRAIGLAVAAMCAVIVGSTADAETSSLVASARFTNDPRADAQRIAAEATAAQAEFRSTCGQADTAAFLAAIGRDTTVGRTASVRLNLAEPGSTAFREAARQVLAAPAEHPLGVDRWLERENPARLVGGPPLSRLQQRLVREEVYRSLTGDHSATSMPRRFRCATARVCPGSYVALTEAERSAVRQAVATLERAVRQGRWAELGLQT